MKEGNFQTWSTRPLVDPPLLEEGMLSYQSTMSNVNLVEGSNVNPEAVTTAMPTLATTVFQTETSVEAVPSDITQRFFQRMPENPLSDFMLRGAAIDRTTLSSTDVSCTNVYAFDPWTSFLANPAIADKAKNYALVRGTIQVVAVVAAPGIAYGMYQLSAISGAGNNSLPPTDDRLIVENCRQVDYTAQIDIAAGNNVALQLPFTWPVDYAPLPGGPVDSWTVTLTCLQPCGTAIPGGLATTSVQFYASLLDDYELALPVYQGMLCSQPLEYESAAPIRPATGRRELRRPPTPMRRVTEEEDDFEYQGKRKLAANETLKRLAPDVHAAIGEGKGSAIAGKVAAVAGSLTSIPVIGGMASAVQAGASMAESVLSFFGFTRVTAENAPLAITQRSVTNVARFDGPDSGDMAALAIGNQISIDPLLSCAPAEDQLSFASLCDRWTLVDVFDWDIGAEGQLGRVFVSPFHCRIGSNAQDLRLTTAGFCGLPFSFWRADMEYEIVIPVSAAHRGSIQFYWIPALVSVPVDPTTISRNVIMDVAQSNTMRLRVGYARDIPFAQCDLITPSVPIVHLGATNGTLACRVVNPLVAQSDTANTRIFVFARAKNVQFAHPRDQFDYVSADGTTPVNVKFIDGVEVYQGATIGDVSPSVDTIDLVPSSGPFPGDDLYYGEVVSSARALMQKPSKLITATPDGNGLVFPIVATLPGESQRPDWTWHNWYASLFVGLAASMRLKVFPNRDCWLGAAPVVGQAHRDKSVVPTLAPMTFCGVNKGAEFTLPYYHPEKFVSPCRTTDSQFSDQRGRFNILRVQGDEGQYDAQLVVYQSLGADIRASRFRQVLKVKLEETLQVTPWFETPEP